MRHLMTHRVHIALLLFAAGCSPPIGWRRRDLLAAPNHNTMVQIWSRDEVVQWYAVVVTPDSITGTPYRKSARCRRRCSLPRSAVDSIRFRYVSPVVTALVVVLGAQALVFEASGNCFFVIPCGRP